MSSSMYVVVGFYHVEFGEVFREMHALFVWLVKSIISDDNK